MAAPRRIGIVGTFDVANFGDLLFPLLAEHELGRRLGAIELTRYSYRELGADAWPYTVRSVATFPDEIETFDLVLVGGGDVIRFDTGVAAGYLPTSPGLHHPTAYWLMPTLVAASAGIPVAWNAVGIVPPVPDWGQDLLGGAAATVDILSVRDHLSLAELERTAANSGRVVPDTAFGTRSLLGESFDRKTVLDRLSISRPYLVLQPAHALRSVREELTVAVAAAQQAGLEVVELAISPIHGDGPTMLDLGDTVVRSSEWPGPRAIAEMIAGAEAVIAHSLHLTIVALASGVPVFRRPSPEESKYHDVERFPGVLLWHSAEELLALIERRRGSGNAGPVVAEQVAQLQAHWDEVAALVGTKKARGKATARVAALAARAAADASSRETRLEHAEAALRESEERKTELDGALAAAHLQNAELEDALTANDAALRDAELRNAELEAALTIREEQSAEVLGELASEREARARTEQHLDAVLATKSWRLLSPLRIVYRTLRR